MNRLVIIGNGFDLAHGLKTSYSDFLGNYLGQILYDYLTDQNAIYEDELIKLNKKNFLNPENFEVFESTEKVIEQLNIIRKKYPKLIELKSDFFDALINQFNNQKWVDIENFYFFYLKTTVKNSVNHTKDVEKLNREFEFLKLKLVEYLKNTTDQYLNVNHNYFWNKISRPIEQAEFVDIVKEETPNSLYILNFNYTNTVEYYLNRQQNITFDINYIHGDLEDLHNPVIFGHGDEHDSDYIEIQNKQKYEFLKHIKSFQYSKSSNYFNLMRFIQAEPFQVFVMGHSLGLSDRTMLKEIFEHENCKSIKLFYHQKNKNENDFTEKVYSLANHFSDKGLMRKKLVPFDKSEKL